MEPKKMTPERLDTVLDAIGHNFFSDLSSELRAHLAAMEAEYRALLADNAMLARRMAEAALLVRTMAGGGAVVARGWASKLEPIVCAADWDHPGAALLSEMEALRKRLAEMEAKHTAQVEWAQKCEDQRVEAERERDEALAQLATLRQPMEPVARKLKAALEDEDVDGDEPLLLRFHPITAAQARAVVDALATTPPPPVVPVAKVLSRMYAARNHGDSGYNTGWSDAIRGAARDLGINLDGEP